MTKHIIFFNTKGGVSKSTLCEYTANELQRIGKLVSVDNTDQQKHVTTILNDNAEYCIYDTAGAFTADNIDLLKARAGVDALVVVPMNTGKNDFQELEFLIERLNEYGLKEKSKFVFTKTRANSKALTARRELLADLGLTSCLWVMPTLEDFSEQRDTKRTRSEINDFLNEVIL
jgi:cellulose biosynthesis protein BcsQ